MKKTYAFLVAYLSCIPAANWMIGNVGTQQFPDGPHVLPVGLGYYAPSGFLLIGVALVCRDYIQRRAGVYPVLSAIAVGIALSALINPAIALASAVAFGLGELADFAVFTPLSERSLPAAVLASGVVGGVIDTFVFLQLAFGSTMFWQGQVIGKTAVAAAGGLAIWGARRVVSNRIVTSQA